MIPYAILSGKVFFSEGESLDIRILELSVDNFTFRLAKKHHEKVISAIRLKFFHFDQSTYREVMLFAGKDIENLDYLTNQDESSKSVDQFFDLYKVVLKNAKSEEYVKIITSEYMKYVELKLAGDDSAMSEQLVGYPAKLDDIYPKTVQEWRDACLKDVNETCIRYLCNGQSHSDSQSLPQLALNLSSGKLLDFFLEMEWKEFLSYIGDTYFSGKLSSDTVPFSCIYIGNQYDYRLLPDPDLLEKTQVKARSLGLKVVLQLPPLKDSLLSEYVELLKLYLKLSKNSQLPEIVANDIGLCALLQEHYKDQFAITLGVLLNKRRKDVRLPYKKGYEDQIDVLKENSLNADFYQSMLLESYGIQKYSYESCEYPYLFAGEGHILHLPYFQMNTGGMADQNSREFTFYPTHLHMIGKNNSLFGYDRRILTDPDYLQGFLKQKPCRIVVDII